MIVAGTLHWFVVVVCSTKLAVKLGLVEVANSWMFLLHRIASLCNWNSSGSERMSRSYLYFSSLPLIYSADKRYAGASKFTRKVGIFKKKFVFIPVCRRYLIDTVNSRIITIIIINGLNPRVMSWVVAWSSGWLQSWIGLVGDWCFVNLSSSETSELFIISWWY